MSGKFSVNTSNLWYRGDIVGLRLFIKDGLGDMLLFDVGSDISNGVLSVLKNSNEFFINKELPGLNGQLRGDKIYFGNDSWTKEINSVSEFNAILQNISKKASRYKSIRKNFKGFIKSEFLDKLKALGVRMPYSGDEEYDVSKLEYSCRFLGGFSEWSGEEEDICDADTMSHFLRSSLDRVCDEFNKTHKDLECYCCNGEKAWVYINIY